MLYLQAFYAHLWYNIMRMINVEEINKLQEKLEKMDREELMEYAIGETISKMTYLDQLASMKRSKFGSTSEKTSLEMLPLFNEIDEMMEILSEFTNVLEHDHFKKYYSLDLCQHAECNAHIDCVLA